MTKQMGGGLASPVYICGLVSAGNSSTTALGAGADFEGVPELTGHPDIMVTCKTDVAGTLFVDISIDGGANYDTIFSFPVAAGGGEFHTAVKGTRTIRVRYVNGSDAQTYFRMQTEYGTFRQGNLPLNGIVQADADALTVRATDAKIDAALGRFLGVVPVNKFGRAPSGVQTSATDVWDRADSAPTQQIWVPPTQARVHAIVSTSSDDDGSPAGTGAHVVRVWGLTAWDTAEVFEDVTLNGTTPVNTSNAYVSIHRMRVIACGASGPNVGSISATAATDSTVTAVIRPTIGSTAMAIYTWPSGKSLLLTDWWGNIRDSSGAASDALVRLFFNGDPENYPALYVEQDARGLQSDGTASDVWPYAAYLPLAGPGILKVNCIGSGADIDMTAGFDALLVDTA